MRSIQSPYKELLSDIDLLIICKTLPKERFRRQELFSFQENPGQVISRFEKIGLKKDINWQEMVLGLKTIY